MRHVDATVEYFTDQFRNCTSLQLRQALAGGLPWPEHIAARTILQERADRVLRFAGTPRPQVGATESSSGTAIGRILGGIFLLALRIFASARPTRGPVTPIPDASTISSARILGKVPATPLRTSARVGERPHNVAT